MSKGELTNTVRHLAGQWEIGEDHGLVALAEAVRRELAQKEGKEKNQYMGLPAKRRTTF